MGDLEKKLGKRIKTLREAAGLTQEVLAEKLAVSRPAISQIEAGEREVSAGELLRVADVFQIPTDRLLDLEKEPEITLKNSEREKEPGPQIRISVPAKNVEKFREVLLYILNKVGSKPNIGETVVYKLLYFVDFDFYEKYEEQLIGATYIKNKYGPTPVEFSKIIQSMIKAGDIVKVQSKYFQYPQTKYLPRREAKLAKLKAHEIRVIDNVLGRLSDLTASKISTYSHEDVPWLTTPEGKTIPYESVFYRTAPYSVRNDDSVSTSSAPS